MVDPGAEKKSKVVDRTREAKMGAKDDIKQDKQKVVDTKPQ